jgi:hypothetical protein
VRHFGGTVDDPRNAAARAGERHAKSRRRVEEFMEVKASRSTSIFPWQARLEM